MGEAIAPGQLAARFPLSGAAIVATARQYFCGTSYQWSGVTPWGADCSGLVQAVYALHGRQLPRDSWQQAELGTTVKDAFTAAQAGDLACSFPIETIGRSRTSAIAAGPHEMVHLSLARGGYAVDRLDDERDPFMATLRARFLFGRRVAVARCRSRVRVARPARGGPQPRPGRAAASIR